MGRYTDAANAALKNKKATSLDSTYWKPEAKGDTRVGRFMEKYSVMSSINQGEYNQYLIETDDGTVKFSMGSAADKEYGERFAYGELYVFEFDGQESLGGGKSVNRWKISHIPSPSLRDNPVKQG